MGCVGEIGWRHESTARNGQFDRAANLQKAELDRVARRQTLATEEQIKKMQSLQAAIEALGKLSPEERAAFVKMLQERAAARGVTLPRELASEPKELGKVLTDLHGKPGQLRDILVGGDAQPQEQVQRSNPLIAILASPQARAVLAGVAAMVVKRVMQASSRTA